MDKILDTMKGIIDKAVEWIEKTFPFVGNYGLYVLIGACALVLILIIVIICVCVKAGKKKKAKKLKAMKDEAISLSESVEDSPAEEKVPQAVDHEIIIEDEVEEKEDEEVEEAVSEEVVEEEVPEETVEEIPEETVEEEAIEIVPEVKEEKKKAPSKKKVAEEPKEVEEKKPAKKSREKKGSKEIDLDNFQPDRFVPLPEEKEEKVEEDKEVKEEKPVEEKPKAAPKKKVPAKKEAEPAEVTKKGVQGKFILVREGETNWRYKLKASNGEILIVSEPYTSEKSVRTGIETLKKNLTNSKLDFVEDKHGLFYFMILTKQGRCLATSASYKTKARATSASNSYMRWAETDIIEIASDEDSEHTEVEKVSFEVEEENTGKFVIKRENDGFIYQLLAANGVVVATSQIYKSKDSCEEACETFRKCVYMGDFFISKDKNSLYQFKLYNKQNRLVLAGEVYEERSRVISVIEAIKRLAKLAKVVDSTK